MKTVVKHLIEHDQSLFNQQNRRRETAPHIAARFGHKGIVEALVRFQRDLIGESSSSENRGSIIGDYTWEEVFSRISTPICKTAFLREVKQAEESHVNDVTRLLQRYEVHDMISNKYPLVRLQNAKGNTPLHEAIAYRQKEVASFLIDLDQQVWFYLNSERKSPLYLAVEAGFSSCRCGGYVVTSSYAAAGGIQTVKRSCDREIQQVERMEIANSCCH